MESVGFNYPSRPRCPLLIHSCCPHPSQATTLFAKVVGYKPLGLAIPVPFSGSKCRVHLGNGPPRPGGRAQTTASSRGEDVDGENKLRDATSIAKPHVRVGNQVILGVELQSVIIFEVVITTIITANVL